MSTVDGLIKIAVIKINVGTFTAQLQCCRDNAFCRRQTYIAANLGTAGEGQLGKAFVLQHILTGFASRAGNNIENTCWQYAVNQTCKFQNRKACFLGRLQYGAVACCQHRRQLPRCHQEREIPGNNLTDYADRLTQDDRQELFVKYGSLTFLRQDAAGKITEMLRRHRNIHVHGFTNRLAVIHAFYHCQMFFVSINNIGNFIQQSGTLCRGSLFPGFKRFPSCCGGCLYILTAALGANCQMAAVGRAFCIIGCAVGCIAPLSVNI